ncbi:unnamed protein product [Malus baccata var. baccata]
MGTTTLLLWFVFVLFEILFHRRSELLAIVASCFFYQLVNWVVLSFVFRYPLFVNTSVSLLHSSITSASDLCRLMIEAGLEAIVSLIKLDMMGSLSAERFRYNHEMPPWLFGPPAQWHCITGPKAMVAARRNFTTTRNATMAFRSPGPMTLCHWPEGIVVFILVNQWLKNGLVGMFEHSELVGHTWPWAYPALCFSCGYFAYDQWDMLHYGLYSGWILSILMHHLVLLICFTLALYWKVTINYLRGIQQLHSIFLHVRKAQRMAGIRDARSKIVRAEWVLNWVTFTFARTAAHLLVTAKLFCDTPKFGKGIELPLALFGMFRMNFLNASLGIDLFHAFKGERNSRHANAYHE